MGTRIERPASPWLLAGLAAMLWALALAVALAVAGQMPAIVAADETLSADASGVAHAHPSIATAAAMLAFLGSGFVLAPLTVLVVVLLWRAGHHLWAAWVGIGGMGGWMISQSVKHLVDRQRPQWPNPFDVLTSPSFPSGHSMAGIYGYVAFGVAAWYVLRRPWNRVVGSVCVAVGLLMGPSRVFRGVHWPSDVLMGWLLASAWLLTVAAGVVWWQQRHRDALAASSG